MKTIFIVLLTVLTANGVAAQTDSDRLLSVMKSELKYDYEQLQKQSLKPYFMSLRAEDTHNMGAVSSFGSVTSTVDNRKRTITPQVRVGSFGLDNFKYYSQGQDQRFTHEVPLTFDDGAELAIRQAICAETTRRYDFACAMYDATKAQAQTRTAAEDKAPCFSKAPVENYYEPAIPASVDRFDKAEWTKKLNEVSAVFRMYPDLITGSATLTYDVVRKYFVNTDGTSIVQNRTAARIMLSASVVADDGMELPLYKDYFSFELGKMPDVETMKAAAKDLAERTVALRKAPVVDPYTGPAIMSGEASGVFFHEIFGHRLEGHRLKEGGETFKNKIGKPILPPSFNVYSDPTLRHYAGTDLNGSYNYDDEGVKARRVDNVVGGIMKSFLVNRVPLDGFPESNGHGRASGGNDPVARQSNLVVETTVHKTDAELRQMLRAEARKQGKEYGYFFRSVSSGYTYTGEGGTLNSFNVTPLEVYRVYVDGRPDELVRGVELIGTPLSMFSNIRAAGGDTKVFTGSCGAESGWIPVTACSPSIFVSKIETQRCQKAQTKPAILPAPEPGDNKPFANDDEKIFKAMSDELDRNLKGLNTDGGQKPFYINYVVSHKCSDVISASLGGVYERSHTPWRLAGQLQVSIGDYRHNSDLRPYFALQAPLSEEVSYDAVRRAFWQGTNQMYNYAVVADAKKKTILAQNPQTVEWADVPDMEVLPKSEYIQTDTDRKDFDAAKAEDLVRRLSLVFKDYNYLTTSSVSVRNEAADVYKYNSEGTKLKLVQGFVRLFVKVGARSVSGTAINDSFTLTFSSLDEFPSYSELEGKVKELAEKVLPEIQSQQNKEAYTGPVLIEGDGVARTFAQTLFTQGKLIAYKPLAGQKLPELLEDKMGQQVLDKRLTVTDNPLMSDYDGKPLLGHYEVDADGVRASEHTLIENGMLKAVLNGRYPTIHAPHSTGSSRFASSGKILVAPGVVTISSSKGIDSEKMKKELIKAARKKGLEYAYIARFFDEGEAFQMFRVSVKDGTETMTEVDQFGHLSEDQLKKLVAISSNQKLTNVDIQGVNVSIIHPESLIIDDFVVSRCNTLATKAPAIPNPAIR